MKKQTPMQKAIEFFDHKDPRSVYTAQQVVNKLYEFSQEERGTFVEFHIECCRSGTERDNGPKFTKEDEIIVREDSVQYFNETFQP
jgi:hypothetical protein